MPRAYCSTCLTMRECRETPSGLVHIHKQPTQWFGRIAYPEKAFKNEQTYRIELGLHYYDMITLPNSGHVPVPIGIHLISKERVAEIPLDRKQWRDEKFFHCDKCFGDGLSFFRCKAHRVSDIEYNHAKEVYLVALAETKKLGKCRYVRAKARPSFASWDRGDRF